MKRPDTRGKGKLMKNRNRGSTAARPSSTGNRRAKPPKVLLGTLGLPLDYEDPPVPGTEGLDLDDPKRVKLEYQWATTLAPGEVWLRLPDYAKHREFMERKAKMKINADVNTILTACHDKYGPTSEALARQKRQLRDLDPELRGALAFVARTMLREMAVHDQAIAMRNKKTA
jgi:hypothetical protein